MSARRRSYRCICCRVAFQHGPDEYPILCPACTTVGCAPWYRPVCMQAVAADDPRTWGVEPLCITWICGPGICEAFVDWPAHPPIARALQVVPREGAS